jgi:hypothetical protein
MMTRLDADERRLRGYDENVRSRPMSALERALLDPDFRPLLFVLTIAGLAALIATAVRAI